MKEEEIKKLQDTVRKLEERLAKLEQALGAQQAAREAAVVDKAMESSKARIRKFEED